MMWHLLQSHPAVCVEPDGSVRVDDLRPAAILSGSFNPLHHGHRGLAAIAAVRLGVPVAFELSIVNADKGEIAPEELSRRVTQFAGFAPIYATRAWDFEKKAELFPGAVLIVGVDTASRIVDPRYYGDDPARRDRALSTVRGSGCRFLVGGRVDARGRFVGLDDVAVPAGFEELFEGISESEFRVDLSSTELRRAMGI